MSTDRRALLRLSGEAFEGGSIGLDPKIVHNIAEQVVTAMREGVQVAIVVDGDNFFRDAQSACEDPERSRADYVGMLGTAMNVLALQDSIDQPGVPTHVQTAITVAQIAEPYLPLRTIRHLERGRVAVFDVGAGLPCFSTNTVSAQHTPGIHYDEPPVAKNGMDDAYDDDPSKDPNAHRFDTPTYSEALRHDLKVIDDSVLALYRDNGLTTHISGTGGNGAMTRVLTSDEVSTLMVA